MAVKKTPKIKIYIVSYQIVGARCSGSWAVSAYNKREAKKMITVLYDGDAVVRSVHTLKEYAQDMGYDSVEEANEDGMLLDQDKKTRWAEMLTKHGECEQLECGT